MFDFTRNRKVLQFILAFFALKSQRGFFHLDTVRSFFFQTLWFANVIVFWLEWAGYLAVPGLNLLAQISDRISPDSV